MRSLLNPPSAPSTETFPFRVTRRSLFSMRQPSRVCVHMAKPVSFEKQNNMRITWAFQCFFFSESLFIACLFNSSLLCFSKLFLFVLIFDIFKVCVLTIEKLCTLLEMAFSFLLVSLRQNHDISSQ